MDFIVLMTLYDKSVQWDFNRRIFPKHIKAQCPPDYDLVDGKSSAISIRGRDVTSLFRSLNVMDDGTIRIEVLARRVPGAAGS
ncbi:MAG: hypothetical protein M5R36_03370 [Deltaproteobacteria bacterium]|nr:hypothetical protein [Deltaproteobacteria bacterium]